MCLRLTIISAALLMVHDVQAKSWTNAAGHAVEAKLVDRKGNLLTLKRPNGATLRIPMSALSEASRKAVEKEYPSKRNPSHAEIVEKRNKQRLMRLAEKAPSKPEEAETRADTP